MPLQNLGLAASISAHDQLLRQILALGGGIRAYEQLLRQNLGLGGGITAYEQLLRQNLGFGEGITAQTQLLLQNLSLGEKMRVGPQPLGLQAMLSGVPVPPGLEEVMGLMSSNQVSAIFSMGLQTLQQQQQRNLVRHLCSLLLNAEC